MPNKIHTVLFLCTGNSARSILAESLLNRDGAGRFKAFSAGSQPKGVVHPLALKTLQENGYPTDGLRSKSWNEFSGPYAPRVDFLFTVCGNAAGETCPLWPRQPTSAHWGIDDPAAAEGSEAEQAQAFALAFAQLKARIDAFRALPLETLDRAALAEELREIGLIEGATLASGQ